jgi:hypothetical protein
MKCWKVHEVVHFFALDATLAANAFFNSAEPNRGVKLASDTLHPTRAGDARPAVRRAR